MTTETTSVYNRYLPSDFQAGEDNLNPKREVAVEEVTSRQLDQAQHILYLAYQNTVDKLAALGTNNQDQAPGDIGTPYPDRVKIQGTVDLGNRVPFSQVPGDPSLPLAKSLVALTLVTGGSLEELKQAAFRELPYDFCKTFGGITPGGGNNTLESKQSSKLPASQKALVDALASALSEFPAQAQLAKASSSAADCLKLELQWLQLILFLLNLVRGIMMLEKMVLAVLWPIINIGAMIAAIWLNPGEIGRLAKYIVGMGQALATGAITNAIQQLIDSWGLDCLLNGSLSAVQAILGTLTGISDVGAAVGSFVEFNQKLVTSTAKEIQVIKSSFQARQAQLDKEGSNGVRDIMVTFANDAFGDVKAIGQSYVAQANAAVANAAVPAQQAAKGAENLQKNLAQISTDDASKVMSKRVTNLNAY